MKVSAWTVVAITVLLKVNSSVQQSSRRRCQEEVTEMKEELTDLLTADRAQLTAVKESVLSMTAIVTAALPEDCSEAMRRGARGSFQMIAPAGMCPRMVRCDMSLAGGGWTVALWRTSITLTHPLNDHNNLLSKVCKTHLSEHENRPRDSGYGLDKLLYRASENELTRTRGSPEELKRKPGNSDMDEYQAGEPYGRRPQQRENFNRTWQEYKDGFGNFQGEYWIGNDMLHALTTSTREPWEALVILSNHNGGSATAIYRQFRVSDEASMYSLHAADYEEGSAGDALTFHSGKRFSTHDRDNDHHESRDCSKENGAGWWFHGFDWQYGPCYESLLTGTAHTEHGHHTLRWRHWNEHLPLHSAALLIRPKPT